MRKPYFSSAIQKAVLVFESEYRKALKVFGFKVKKIKDQVLLQKALAL